MSCTAKPIRRSNYVLLFSHFRRLRRLRRDRRVAELIAELRNPFEVEGISVRGRAAHHLGRLRAEESVHSIVSMLKDRSETVRAQAADALGRIRPSAAVPALMAALDDDSDLVRGAAITSLGGIGDASAVPRLLPFLQEESWYQLRGRAEHALLLIDHAGGRQAAAERVRKERWTRRWAIRRAVWRHRRRERAASRAD